MTEGIWLAAEAMVMLMDHPSMDLTTLRESPPAKQFRSQVLAMRNWLKDGIEILSDEQCPPEEKRFLKHWFEEFDRREANRAVIAVRRDQPGGA
jgi:hypothetical protein